MKVIDRLRVMRRVLLLALNPKVETLSISYEHSESGYNCRYIGDRSKSVALYSQDLIRLYTNNSDTAAGVRRRLLSLCDNVQIKWNEEHPEDQLDLIHYPPDEAHPSDDEGKSEESQCS